MVLRWFPGRGAFGTLFLKARARDGLRGFWYAFPKSGRIVDFLQTVVFSRGLSVERRALERPKVRGSIPHGCYWFLSDQWRPDYVRLFGGLTHGQGSGRIWQAFSN